MNIAKLWIVAVLIPLTLGVYVGCVPRTDLGKTTPRASSDEGPGVSSQGRDPLRTGAAPRDLKLREYPSAMVEKKADSVSSAETLPDQETYPDSEAISEGQLKAAHEPTSFPEEKSVSGRAAETVRHYAVDKDFVEQRLKLYMAKRDQWNEAAGTIIQLNLGNSWPAGWHECLQKTEMLIFGYHRVKARLDEKDFQALPDPWDLLAKDISYAEGECEKILADSQTRFSEKVASYSGRVSDEVRGLINEYLSRGMYSEVAAFYEAQVGIDAQIIDDHDLRKRYAEALLRLGRLDETVGILQELNESNGAVVNETLFTDRVHYADILFAAGYYERAVQEYDRIKNQLDALADREAWVIDQADILRNNNTAQLDDYRKILRLYYESDGTSVPAEIYRGIDAIEQENQSVMLASAHTILRNLEQAVEENAEKQLNHVQELLLDKEFAGARRIANELSVRGSEDIKEKATLALEQINEAEGAEKLTLKQLQQQKIKNQRDKARHLYETQEYDGAIAEYSLLLNTEYKKEAAAKIVEAAEIAAAEMRRVAASLFVKARKTTDTEEKVGFLLESKKMLYDLLNKYPGTEIIGKVEQNLQVLEEELAKYSLPQPEQSSSSEDDEH